MTAQQFINAIPGATGERERWISKEIRYHHEITTKRMFERIVEQKQIVVPFQVIGASRLCVAVAFVHPPDEMRKLRFDGAMFPRLTPIPQRFDKKSVMIGRKIYDLMVFPEAAWVKSFDAALRQIEGEIDVR